jgi:hypothetical protein
MRETASIGEEIRDGRGSAAKGAVGIKTTKAPLLPRRQWAREGKVKQILMQLILIA